MIGPGTGVRVYLACGVTDMRKRISRPIFGQTSGSTSRYIAEVETQRCWI
ncbi:putative isocitrate lyase [Donghicola eburneus]|jgi:hypothetical protein|uniref:Putative isocitrate lyase n=1 Tax=Donghicola eburneus TaxID=393278 RepID=A0A1M4MVR4_9RHOB|nr:putative isocitrate lyase [Donghicola eburneus]